MTDKKPLSEGGPIVKFVDRITIRGGDKNEHCNENWLPDLAKYFTQIVIQPTDHGSYHWGAGTPTVQMFIPLDRNQLQKDMRGSRVDKRISVENMELAIAKELQAKTGIEFKIEIPHKLSAEMSTDQFVKTMNVITAAVVEQQRIREAGGVAL